MNIEHLAIWADNLEVMRRFYMDYFGAACSDKYINPAKNYTSYFLSFEGAETRIELMNIPDTLPRPYDIRRMLGLAHFAVSVGTKASVDTLTERLRKDGYTITGEPRTTGDGYYESVVADPEGNLIEICA